MIVCEEGDCWFVKLLARLVVRFIEKMKGDGSETGEGGSKRRAGD